MADIRDDVLGHANLRGKADAFVQGSAQHQRRRRLVHRVNIQKRINRALRNSDGCVLSIKFVELGLEHIS